MRRSHRPLVPAAALACTALLACTVNVHQPRVTGVETVTPSTPPIPTIKPPPPGTRIVDSTLNQVTVIPKPTGVRLPGPDDVPPSEPPAVGDVLDQQSLIATLDLEVRGPGRAGQRFRAMRSGTLKAVGIRLRAAEGRAVTGRVSLHEMNEDGTPAELPLARSEVLTLLEAGQPSGWCRATFPLPASVGRNVTYVWVIQPSPEMAVRLVAGPEPSYPDGTGWISSSEDGLWNRARMDFSFQTWVAAP